MGKPLVIVIGLVLLVSLLLFSATYTVKYHQVGIKTRFGQATDNVINEAGLGFKFPSPIDKVITLDRRLQMLETPLETIQTTDGQQLVVRAFLLWRVDAEGLGPRTFYNNYATIEDAQDSIRTEFRTHVKNGVSAYRFNDLIGEASKIVEAEESIVTLMQSMKDKGVVPMTVGFNQVSLPAKTTNVVIGRMHAERKQLAEIERIKGQAEAQRIQSLAQIDADKIRSFAQQRAEEIMAQGDAQAARYLAEMAQDEDLAIFLVWLDALQASLGQYGTYVLPTVTAPFHLMDLNTPTGANGIPMPAEGNDFADRAADPAAAAAATGESLDNAVAEGDSGHE